MSKVLRNIPSVNELLESPPLQSLVERVNRSVVVSGCEISWTICDRTFKRRPRK